MPSSKTKLTSTKAYQRRLRDDVIAAYGGQCACCGISDRKYLHLYHIEGRGKEDRKLHGWGYRFHLTLKQRGFPPGLQVLCANCHNAKTYYTGCDPHTTSPAVGKSLLPDTTDDDGRSY